jgi:RNA polymerase subunit RPABC4/transcription elongation factor Spt4
MLFSRCGIGGGSHATGSIPAEFEWSQGAHCQAHHGAPDDPTRNKRFAKRHLVLMPRPQGPYDQERRVVCPGCRNLVEVGALECPLCKSKLGRCAEKGCDGRLGQAVGQAGDGPGRHLPGAKLHCCGWRPDANELGEWAAGASRTCPVCQGQLGTDEVFAKIEGFMLGRAEQRSVWVRSASLGDTYLEPERTVADEDDEDDESD